MTTEGGRINDINHPIHKSGKITFSHYSSLLNTPRGTTHQPHLHHLQFLPLLTPHIMHPDPTLNQSLMPGCSLV